MQHALAHKSPKVTAEAAVWVAQCIEEFGLGHLGTGPLLDFVSVQYTQRRAHHGDSVVCRDCSKLPTQPSRKKRSS